MSKPRKRDLRSIPTAVIVLELKRREGLHGRTPPERPSLNFPSLGGGEPRGPRHPVVGERQYTKLKITP